MASLTRPKHTQHHHQKHKYKPMLCSSSNQDQVKMSYSPRRRSISSSLSSSSSSCSSEEPCSPRVGCMGQVKMKNYPINGFDNTNNNSNNTQNEHHSNNYYINSSMVKYLNLRFKGFFSSKTITTFSTSAIRAASIGPHKAKIGVKSIHIKHINKESQMGVYHNPRPSNSHSARIVLCRCNIENNSSNNYKGCTVNLKEMDPPLPVVKRISRLQEAEEENLSIWKRRHGGIPLKSLELHQVIHKQAQVLLLPANTV